jgi:uncharacterized protein YcfJ
MKKLTVLLAGLGLLLIAGGFEKALAQEKQITYRVDTLAQGQVIIRQPMEIEVEAKPTKNYIFLKPDPVQPGKIAGEVLAGGMGAALGGILGAGIGYGMTHNEN